MDGERGSKKTNLWKNRQVCEVQMQPATVISLIAILFYSQVVLGQESRTLCENAELVSRLPARLKPPSVTLTNPNVKPQPGQQITDLLEFKYGPSTPLTSLERVEIYRCPGLETLTFVAWKADSATADLIAGTTDRQLVQILVKGNVFVIETSGGPQTFWVIVFEKGTPRLALIRSHKTMSTLTSTLQEVTLAVKNPDGTESRYSFPTGEDGDAGP